MFWLTFFMVLVLLLVGYEVWCWVSCFTTVNSASLPTATTTTTTATTATTRTIVPDRVNLRHVIGFSVQKANYYLHIFTSIFHVCLLYLGITRKATVREGDVIAAILNSSLILWCKAEKKKKKKDPRNENEEKKRKRNEKEKKKVSVKIELTMQDFALIPSLRGAAVETNNTLSVVMEIPFNSDEERCRQKGKMLSFILNGQEVPSCAEQMNLVGVLTSTVVHPIIHSFANGVYKHADAPKLRRDYPDFFLHSQYLNWVSYFWPSICFRVSVDLAREAFIHNSRLPIPIHPHVHGLDLLAPSSSFFSFIIKARSVFMRCLHKHGVLTDLDPLDPRLPEALFLCTTVHAVEHYSLAKSLNGYWLSNTVTPNGALHHFIVQFFYRPSQYFCTNLLRDKRNKNPFYSDLYSQLRNINQELADQVTLSLAY